MYRNGAYRRSLDWEIDEDEFLFLTKQDCYYCGIGPSREHKNRHWNGGYIYNGIDRLDSSVGYVHGNYVTACGTCNYAKQSLNQEEFLNLINRIYHHRIAA